MGVTINLHRIFRGHTGGLESVEVDGQTVGECLDILVRRFPGMREALFSSRGELHRHVEIYLNAESAYPNELKKPVQPGDEMHITLIAVFGG